MVRRDDIGSVGEVLATVSQLCIVTKDYDIKLDEIKQHFTLIDMRENEGVIQSGED